VQKPGTVTYTSALAGMFRESEKLRAEFLRFVELADTKNL
jgi:GTP cyclohydrolase I